MNRTGHSSEVTNHENGDGAGLKGMRVLVVEDNALSAALLEKLLSAQGHRVDVAHDGDAALEVALAKEPDVVLLDIGLPGMNGWEVAKLLLAQPAKKKPFVVAITGLGREEDYRTSAAVGVDLHLVKPTDAQQLVNLLRRFQRVIQ
jgi:DNA-binding response OmpR family regulator